MVRKSMLLAAALFAAVAAIPASAGPNSAPAIAAQSDNQPVDATGGEQLTMGQRFEGNGFSFEAQDVYTARSLTRTGYDEVRVAVAFVNGGPDTMNYSTIALAGSDGFPSIQVRDSAGVAHPVDTRDPGNALAPGSNLTVVPAGMPVHWTAGFQVPSAYVGSMQLEIVSNGSIVASFSLNGEPRTVRGFDAPAGLDEAGFGQTVQWSDGVSLTFKSVETVACGAPELVHSAVSAIVEVSVENTDVVDQFFPAVRHPGVTGYAVWEDGSSGRYVGATTVFPTVPEGATTQEVNELTAEGVRSIPNTRSSHEIVVPPGYPLNLGIVFQTPRDSRFADVTADPVGLWLTPPDGSAVWIDLTGEATSDFSIADEFQTDVACAIGQPTLFLGTADEPQSVNVLVIAPPEEAGG